MEKPLADSILARSRDEKFARIFQGNTQKPFQVQKIVIDLTTAKLDTAPYQINFPFRSFYVQDATDTAVTINFKPGAQDSFQSSFAIKKNDAWISDYPITAAFLDWSAQSGKSITIVFFTDAEFRSGSQISVTGGAVAITEGSSFTEANVTMTAATATLIRAQNTARFNLSVQNNTGADLWIGGSSVSSTTGFKVPAGGTFIWKNTAAIYGYSVAGGSVYYMEES